MAEQLNEIVLIASSNEARTKDLSAVAIKQNLSLQTITGMEEYLLVKDNNQLLVMVLDLENCPMDTASFTKDFKSEHMLVPVMGVGTPPPEVMPLVDSGQILFAKDTAEFGTKLEEVVKARIDAIAEEEEEMKELTACFVEEVTEMMENIDDLIMSLESNPPQMDKVDSLFRIVHSVKGGAGAFPKASTLKDLAHIFENDLSLIRESTLVPNAAIINTFLQASDLCKELISCLERDIGASDETLEQVAACIESLKQIHSGGGAGGAAPEAAAPAAAKAAPAAGGDKSSSGDKDDSGVFVTNEKLDDFMKLSGELIVMKNYFEVFSRDKEVIENPEKMLKKLSDFNYSLHKMTDQLQEHIMNVRKVRLDKAFSKIPRMVREVSSSLGKEVSLQQVGLSLGVDKNIAKAMSACMTHMVRNSLDHGIESPEVREGNGKSSKGTVRIQAHESQGRIYIEVTDDGGGISKDKVLEKAIKKELVSPEKGATLADTDIFDFIFMPGFSTAEKISDVSGRGVGMDVVKSGITKLGGTIKLFSAIGEGTTISIEIPIPKTVMVEETVLATSSPIEIAIPLTSVQTISPVRDLITSEVNKVRTCQYNNKTIPIFSYQDLYGKNPIKSTKSFNDQSVVIIKHKEDWMALLVDQINDQMEAVVRPFDTVVKEAPGFKGTTLLGDDQIAYVISDEDVINLATHHYKVAKVA